MATTNSNTIYSEYLLYEPIYRILQSKGYDAHCEYAVERTNKKGDNKKIDFRVKKDSIDAFGLEVKWAKNKTINVEKDIKKLMMYNDKHDANGYLLVFGHYKFISVLKFSKGLSYKSSGKVVNWNSGKTNYAACWYKIV